MIQQLVSIDILCLQKTKPTNAWYLLMTSHDWIRNVSWKRDYSEDIWHHMCGKTSTETIVCFLNHIK